MTAFRDGVRIPDPRAARPCNALEIFTDAAGISKEKPRNGWGSFAVIDGVTVMASAPWNRKMVTPDERYHKRLTWLEALAVADGVFSVAEMIAGKHVIV